MLKITVKNVEFFNALPASSENKRILLLSVIREGISVYKTEAKQHGQDLRLQLNSSNKDLFLFLLVLWAPAIHNYFKMIYLFGCFTPKGSCKFWRESSILVWKLRMAKFPLICSCLTDYLLVYHDGVGLGWVLGSFLSSTSWWLITGNAPGLQTP